MEISQVHLTIFFPARDGLLNNYTMTRNSIVYSRISMLKSDKMKNDTTYSVLTQFIIPKVLDVNYIEVPI